MLVKAVSGSLVLGLLLACSVATEPPPPAFASLASADKNLKGCSGKASSSVPSDGVYVITTFGGETESQPMSCGSHTKSGSWYYAASRQRYGCGSKIQIEANGKCVVAQTDDYGPDVCVENAAGMPIIDVSPLVAQDLFGTSGMGWSDKKTVTVTQVAKDTALGPCSGKGDNGGQNGGAGSGSGGSGGSGGGQCYCDSQSQSYGDCCANCGGGGSGSGGSSGGSGTYCGDGWCDAGEDCFSCASDCTCA